MNKLIALFFLLASTIAGATCGDLTIQIVNRSNHTCVFKNKLVYYGALEDYKIPNVVNPFESSPLFNASQDNVGVGIHLTYLCDKEVVKFYSWQSYCSFLGGAGPLGGTPHTDSTLNLSYETYEGSLITGRPGKIVWRIS